ncbi:uncharacterized protein LOC126742026 [Anthonomus grandis grandis]|uniref:uncharacterized protein LOC126742026 n=1 Tax=Anthonomus grandis grandis TaxID=2921223 RepID=UPI0021668962|nr:uncharacterized protein LOC126742026 [Anthonomus grandis grandis]
MHTFYLAVFLFSVTNGFGPPKDPRSILKVTNVYLCPNHENVLIFDKRYLDNIDDDGYKKFSGELELPSDFDASWQYELKVDRMDGGDWQEDVYNREGQLCEDVETYFADAWKKVGSTLDPPFESDCSVKAGVHKITDLQVLKEEYKIPNVMVGSVRVTLKLFDTSGDQVFCGVLEGQYV